MQDQEPSKSSPAAEAEEPGYTINNVTPLIDGISPQEAAELEKGKKKVRIRRKLWFRHKDVNAGQASFAAGLNIYKLLWVFFIGCVIGVVFETLYVFATTGVWMRRSGMLYGPFNQVFGFGAVLFTVLLYRYRHKNSFVIFLAATIIGTVFEYVCSWVQEIFFGSVSWDYTEMSTSIGGRTNLMFGVGWGIMGLLFLTIFWPFMSEMIERIPNTIGKTVTIVVSVFLAVNLLLSALAVYRYGQRAENIPAANVVESWLDSTYPDNYMAEKYPSMEFRGKSADSGQTPD